MEKKFYIVEYVKDESDRKFDTYEQAEEHARRKAGNDRDGDKYYVCQAVSVAVAPVPAAEVSKLS